MIPDREILYSGTGGIVEMPSLTYAIELERENEEVYGEGRISGYCDKTEAMKQAVYKILRTQKDRFLIYGSYGTEHMELVGQPQNYAIPELERRIREALLRDSRITSVDNFIFGGRGSEVTVSFDVHTIFGTFNEVIENV